MTRTNIGWWAVHSNAAGNNQPRWRFGLGYAAYRVFDNDQQPTTPRDG